MPGGLVLFNRILPLASDDLSIPSFFLFCLHVIGISFALIAISLFPSPFDCFSIPPPISTKIFITFFISVHSIFCILDLMIFYFSLQGTVSNPAPRKPVTALSYIYLFWLFTFDLASGIIGLLGLPWFDLEKTRVNCSSDEAYIPLDDSLRAHIWTFRILLYYEWALFALITLAMGSLFLSSIQNQISPSDRHHHFKRFISPIFFTKSLFFSRGREHRGPDPQQVLQSVALLLTDLFASVNMCASDIVVGLILVRQRYLEEEEENDEELHDLSFQQSLPIFDMSRISYYSQYAEAMYGIPLLWYSDFFRGTKYMCCPCLHLIQSPVDAIEKTMETGCQAFFCCFPGSWLVHQSTHPDLIYKSIQGKIFKSPFAVSIDRNTQSIIISVRGTLSTTDLLVDLYLDEQQIEWIDIAGNHNVGYVHKGMFAIAIAILNELREKMIISLLDTDEELRNMVIICTGHSLGAGVCALLAFLLKSTSFGARVYAICYSSPGFLISASAISYFQTFCTSIVLGDDFVCRINPHNTEDLKDLVYAELQSCNQRKIDIFSKEIIRKIFIRRKENQRESREPLLKRANDSQIDSRVYNGQKLYIAGNVLHLRKKERIDDGAGSSSGNTTNSFEGFEPRWIDPVKFGRRMIVSDKMLIHHFPNRVGDVLRTLAQQTEFQADPNDHSLRDQAEIKDEILPKPKKFLILIDYQFESLKKLLQVKKYLVKSSNDLPFNKLRVNSCFALKNDENRIELELQSVYQRGISMKCYVYKKSRVKTTGGYFLLFCEMNKSGNDWRFLIMVKEQGESSLGLKSDLYFLRETIELDVEYCFENLQCTKIKISPNQQDFTRCFLYTTDKSIVRNARVYEIDHDSLFIHNDTLLSFYTNYFSLVSQEDLESEKDLINYSGKITKICNHDNLSYYEIDHSNRLYLLHIGFHTSSSLLYSLLPGAMIHLLNFHMDLSSDGISANFFPCCNSEIVIVDFSTPSHGLMSPLKLSKSMLNANFYDMILFNSLLDKFSNLKKFYLSLTETKTKECDIWRDNKDTILPHFTNPRNLRTIMISLGWTELKPSKMELLEHSKCQVANARLKHSTICNIDRLIAKALTNAGDNIGIYDFSISDAILCFYEMHSAGIGRIRDESGSLFMIVNPNLSTTLFKFYSKPGLILITKAVLVIEKYTRKIEPLIYLIVKTEDITSLSNLDISERDSIEDTDKSLLFVPTLKRPIRIAFDRHGMKHLQGNISGFLRIPKRNNLLPIYIRFAGSYLNVFHALHLFQTYIVKIPSKYISLSLREIVVEWGHDCSVSSSLTAIECTLPSMTCVSDVIENPLYYCTESSIITLVNFHNLTIISKTIQNVHILPSNSSVLPGLTHKHDTVLGLSSDSLVSVFKVYVVDSNVPLLAILPGHRVSLFGIKVEMRQGELVGIAGVGSMIILSDSLPKQAFPNLKIPIEKKQSFKTSMYLKDLFPLLHKRNFPMKSWISVVPLKIFDMTLDSFCFICSKSRYSLICEYCSTSCKLIGTCTALVHDSSLEFFITIDGAENILKLINLEASEQRIMEYLAVRQECLKIYGSFQSASGIDFSSRDEVNWIEEHCVMGSWKRRINIQIVSIPAFLLQTPLFGNEEAPATFTNPSILKVCSTKDLSGNNFLTISPKWIKVKVGSIQECDPIQEAFDLISELLIL